MYSDEQFSSFLKSTQEKLSKFSLRKDSQPNINLSADDSDEEEFESFLSKLKKAKENVLDSSCAKSDDDFENLLRSSVKKPNVHESDEGKYQTCKLNDSETATSDEDQEFENFISYLKTPKSKAKENVLKELSCSGDSSREYENFISNFKTPQHDSSNKRDLVLQTSSSDEEFENIIATLKDPKSNKENLTCGESDSINSSLDSEKEFENYLSDLKAIKSDHETKFQTKTPVSKVPLDSSQSNNKSSTRSLKSIEEKAEKSFMLYRKTCSSELYCFFNEKIFAGKLPIDMPVKWTGALLSTAGLFKAKRVGTSSIELSSPILTSFDKLRDTLLHEMCHAACWIINKKSDQHGPLWRTWAARCNVIFPELEVPTRCHNYEIQFHYELKCTLCPWKRKRLKMCPKLQVSKCPRCFSSTKLFQL